MIIVNQLVPKQVECEHHKEECQNDAPARLSFEWSSIGKVCPSIPKIKVIGNSKVHEDQNWEQYDTEHGIWYEERDLIQSCENPCWILTDWVSNVQEYLTEFASHTDVSDHDDVAATDQCGSKTHPGYEVMDDILLAKRWKVFVYKYLHYEIIEKVGGSEHAKVRVEGFVGPEAYFITVEHAEWAVTHE